MTAKQDVIDLAFLTHRIEVELLNSLQRIRVKFSEAFAARFGIVDKERSLETAAISKVVLDDGSHLALARITIFAHRLTCVGACSSLLCSTSNIKSGGD